MASWFANGFRMTLGARKMVRTFLEKRTTLATLPEPSVEVAARLLCPEVATRIDPRKTFRELLTNGWNLATYARKPAVSVKDIHA